MFDDSNPDENPPRKAAAMTAGEYLLELRLSKNVTLTKLAAACKVSVSTIFKWEQDQLPLPEGEVPAIGRALGLNEKEITGLRIFPGPANAVPKRLSDSDLSNLHLHERAGAYLANLRQRDRMRVDELAKACGYSEGTVSGWETGRTPLDESKIRAVSKALCLHSEEENHLIELCKASEITFNAPLPGSNLQNEPQQQRAGLYLARMRMMRHLTQAELSEMCGVPVHVVANWESGKQLLYKDSMLLLAKKMALDDIEVHRLWNMAKSAIAAFVPNGDASLPEKNTQELIFRSRSDNEPGQTPVFYRKGKVGAWEKETPPSLAGTQSLARMHDLPLDHAVQLVRLGKTPSVEDMLNGGYQADMPLEELPHVSQNLRQEWWSRERERLSQKQQMSLIEASRMIRLSHGIEPKKPQQSLPDAGLAQWPEAERAGRLLRSLREQRGLTREALASMLDVSSRSVVSWERGERNLTKDRVKDVTSALALDWKQTLQLEMAASAATPREGKSV